MESSNSCKSFRTFSFLISIFFLFCALHVYLETQKKHRVHILDCYIVHNVVHIFLWNVPYIELLNLSFLMVQHCVLWIHLKDVLLHMSHIDVFDTCHNAGREQQSNKECTEIHFWYCV